MQSDGSTFFLSIINQYQLNTKFVDNEPLILSDAVFFSLGHTEFTTDVSFAYVFNSEVLATSTGGSIQRVTTQNTYAYIDVALDIWNCDLDSDLISWWGDPVTALDFLFGSDLNQSLPSTLEFSLNDESTLVLVRELDDSQYFTLTPPAVLFTTFNGYNDFFKQPEAWSTCESTFSYAGLESNYQFETSNPVFSWY